MHIELPIVIVGAGLGGLCAALALSRAGRTVRVLERAEHIREIGAGVQLGPNVFRVLDKLGVAGDVLGRCVFPERLVMMDSISGQTITSITAQGAFRDRFCYPYALIHRADLLQTLLDRCLSQPLITIMTSQQVVGFEDAGDCVVAHAANGARHEGAALIGADGIASCIRGCLVQDGPPRSSGYIAYRTLLPVEDVPVHLRAGNVTLWAGPQHHIVHYPLRDGRIFNIVAAFRSNRAAEGWETQGNAEELHEHFESAVPEIKALLSKLVPWRVWLLCDRDPIKQWCAGRVALIGDAAHPMLQYLGQGAGMAIEDAFVLAEEIAACGGDYPRAFAAYQAKRYVRAGRAQLTSRLYGEFFHATGASREIRNQFLAGRSENEARESLAWLYDGPELQPVTSTPNAL